MASTINAAVGGIVNTADASGELALQASGTTVATLTASGNVGIGTTSPSYRVDARRTSYGVTARFFTEDGTRNPRLLIYGSADGTTLQNTFSASAGSLMFAIGGAEGAGTEVARFDASGNLGLGVTPSAWASTYKAMQLGSVSSVADTGSATRVTSNGFVNSGGTNIYLTSAAATTYIQSAGQHLWYNAPSGTAGNAISFTQAMTLTSTGNLLVGTTTDLSGVTGAISDSAGNVRAIPQSGAAKTTSYTLVKGDVGEFINVGSGGSIVIPDAVFATGDVVSVFNNTSGNITITCSITTAYIGGTDADKATITLATRGIATILFISGTVCVVNGNVS